MDFICKKGFENEGLFYTIERDSKIHNTRGDIYCDLFRWKEILPSKNAVIGLTSWIWLRVLGPWGIVIETGARFSKNSCWLVCWLLPHLQAPFLAFTGPCLYFFYKTHLEPSHLYGCASFCSSLFDSRSLCLHT